MSALDGTVAVTGASGFIAQHCIAALLARGIRVRGTVRTAARGQAVRGVLARLPDLGARAVDPALLDFAVADLSRDDGWEDALRGCRHVLHVASPLPRAAPKDADDVMRPARDGTLRVLRAARRAGVQRVVLTSSLSAVVFTKDRAARERSEQDWSDDEAMSAYDKSKTLAERAAWDFVRALPQRESIELVSINPGLVLGPVLAQDTSASAEIVRKLLAREVPGCPRVGWAVVDVRDVAEAHVLAMLVPQAAGERFCCAVAHTWMRDIAAILDEHFRDRGYRVPTRALPDLVVRAMAVFDPSARLVVHKLGRRIDVSIDRITRVLGWRPRPVRQAVVDMAESLIAHAIV